MIYGEHQKAYVENAITCKVITKEWGFYGNPSDWRTRICRIKSCA